MAVWKNLTFRSLCTLCKPIRSMLRENGAFQDSFEATFIPRRGHSVSNAVSVLCGPITCYHEYSLRTCWHIRKIQTDNSTVIYSTVKVNSSQTTRTFWGYSRVQNLRDISPCWKSVKPSLSYENSSLWNLCRGKELRATKIMTPFGTLFE